MVAPVPDKPPVGNESHMEGFGIPATPGIRYQVRSPERHIASQLSPVYQPWTAERYPGGKVRTAVSIPHAWVLARGTTFLGRRLAKPVLRGGGCHIQGYDTKFVPYYYITYITLD